LQKQEVLALYDTDKTTGLVINSGHGASHIVPIYEGLPVPNAIQKIPLSGKEVSQYLRGLLHARGLQFNTSVEIEQIRKMKEEM